MKFTKNYFVCLLLSTVFPYILFADNDGLKSASFNFLSEKINVEYDPDMIVSEDICIKQKCFKTFYNAMEKKPYKDLIANLEEIKNDLNLNDWLVYKLTKTAVNQILKDKNDELQKGMTTWFLLNEMDYDVRIAVTEKGDPFLFVKTEDEMGRVPSFSENELKFVNLTAVDFGIETKKIQLYRPEFIANRKGDSFKFYFETSPKLKGEPVAQNITFKWHEEELNISFKVDKQYAAEMANYPQPGLMGFINAPLSATAQATLIPAMKKIIAGKSNREALEIIVSFTRQAFKFKSDWPIYDDEHPMFAEEVFLSDYSDHEDRSAVFYFLVKELLDLPMVVITHYNLNMTIGVALEGDIKRPFEYKGKNYVICDPTIPSGSSDLGKWPNGMTFNTAKVIGSYKYE